MPTRHFLDWNHPLLPLLADRLLPETIHGPVTFEDQLIVVPTRQAGRRLREYLAREVRKRGGTALLSLKVRPPASFLQHPTLSPAEPADVLLAWQAVLGNLSANECPNLLPGQSKPMPPSTALAFGKRLQALRNELVDADLDFQSVASREADFPDRERWKDLATLEGRYLAILEQRDLHDPCALKREAAKSPDVSEGVKRIILAGVPDPSPIVLQRLQHLEQNAPVEIECWIHAPESLADLFDDWGQPVREWANRHIHDLPKPIQTPSPALACRAAAAAIQEMERRQPGAHLALGLLDSQQAPLLDRELATHRINAFHPSPTSLAQHEIVRLIRSLVDAGRNPDLSTLRPLLQHPDLLVYFSASNGVQPSTILRQWDELVSFSLPTTLHAAQALSREPAFQAIAQALRSLSSLLTDLQGPRPLQSLLRLLHLVYEGQSLREARSPDQRQHLASLRKVADLLQEAVRRELREQPFGLELLLQLLNDLSVDPVRGEEILDAEGWLELSYHPAPSLILIGFQEGLVPATRIADAFLPDSFRQELGLRADHHLLPRDAYLLQSMLACRPDDAVRIYCYKTDAGGSPSLPSRLLFQVPDAALLENVRTLFREIELHDPRPVKACAFPLAIPELAPLASMGVTAFRSYLACPTRFFLGYVLRMETKDDCKREPDAMDFGNWVHKVLERLLRDPGFAECSDPQMLSARSNELLEELSGRQYGHAPSLATRIAVEAAQKRLQAACRVQAGIVAEGWTTLETELKLEREINGILVKGRIDRVDYHPDHGLRLLDYKTSNKATDPEDAHWKPARNDRPEAIRLPHPEKNQEKEWTNLQLPLYRWLLETHSLRSRHETLRVGYFSLPKALNETGIQLWKNEGLCIAEAEAAIDWVTRQVADGVYAPTADQPRYDEFEHIIEGVCL